MRSDIGKVLAYFDEFAECYDGEIHKLSDGKAGNKVLVADFLLLDPTVVRNEFFAPRAKVPPPVCLGGSIPVLSEVVPRAADAAQVDEPGLFAT